VAVLCVFCQHLSDTLGEIFRRHIFRDAWAHGMYNFPVCGVDEDTVNEGPNLAHARFHRVDGADFIPKDAITRLRASD
jgi:hypothetical protein